MACLHLYPFLYMKMTSLLSQTVKLLSGVVVSLLDLRGAVPEQILNEKGGRASGFVECFTDILS